MDQEKDLPPSVKPESNESQQRPKSLWLRIVRWLDRLLWLGFLLWFARLLWLGFLLWFTRLLWLDRLLWFDFLLWLGFLLLLLFPLKSLFLCIRFSEIWHGRYPAYYHCDYPPSREDIRQHKLKTRRFSRARFFGPKEFENKWFSLDMFICIPKHLRYYESWEERLREKHKRFLSFASPPETPQIVSGINVELLKEQYQMQIRLYEKYLDLLIRFNFLNFAITGAILSFSLQSGEQNLVRWSFAFPFFMNLSFALLILLAFRSLKIINREIIYMSEFLGFQPPGVRTLRHALAVSFFTLLLVALVLFPTAFNVCDLKMYKVNVNWILSNRPSPTAPTYPCNTPEDDLAARQREQEANPR
ncbi:MAG TPA: hypothetical protein VGB76_20885 [Pyrinomonadaceae bacterium]|jgi:hypothetical protein